MAKKKKKKKLTTEQKLENTMTTQRDTEIGKFNELSDAQLGRLATQEAETRGTYGGYLDQIRNYLGEYQGIADKAKAGQLEQLANQEQSTKEQYQGALGNVRGVLSDLAKRQDAYATATGGYDSSTAGALQEQFGRQANTQVGQLDQQRAGALREIGGQKNQVETTYQQNLLNAKQSYDGQAFQLQQQLLQQIDAINNARNMTDAQRTQATVDAWRNFSNSKVSLDMQMWQFKKQMDMWQQQFDAQKSMANKQFEQQKSLQDAQMSAYNTPKYSAGGFSAPKSNVQWGNVNTDEDNMKKADLSAGGY